MQRSRGRDPRLDAEVQALHAACAAALKNAFELGCALATAMDAKALRTWYGRPRFEPETDRFRSLLESLLDRGRTFWTGGGRLRAMLDDAANAYGPCDVYFGWKYALTARMRPCTRMTMADAAQVREFVDRLEAALDLVTRVDNTLPVNIAIFDDMACTPARRYDIDSTCLAGVLRAYRRHILEFRRVYREWCAVTIQRAWRRARDTPGFAVWRKRMLAEFHEMQDMLCC